MKVSVKYSKTVLLTLALILTAYVVSAEPYAFQNHALPDDTRKEIIHVTGRQLR